MVSPPLLPIPLNVFHFVKHFELPYVEKCYKNKLPLPYSYTGAVRQHSRFHATLLFLTLLVSACIWVVWITMLVRGNPELDRRPRWDDPVICIALVANGWVLLMGYGLSQIAFFCRGEAKSKDLPLSFAGWTSPSADIPGLNSPKEGNENGSFESDSETRRGEKLSGA